MGDAGSSSARIRYSEKIQSHEMHEEQDVAQGNDPELHSSYIRHSSFDNNHDLFRWAFGRNDELANQCSKGDLFTVSYEHQLVPTNCFRLKASFYA